jgi:hypothetical protein
MTILSQVSEMVASGCETLIGLLGDVMRTDYNGNVLVCRVHQATFSSLSAFKEERYDRTSVESTVNFLNYLVPTEFATTVILLEATKPRTI